jgi:hypothetical protein
MSQGELYRSANGNLDPRLRRSLSPFLDLCALPLIADALGELG